jgi:hypothetical protein
LQTLAACGDAETVAFVYLITGEKKYGENARKRILDLASWDPDGETNFRRNCEAAKPLLHRLARAYDWAYDALSAEDRQRVRTAAKRRIDDAWVSSEVGRGVGHINQPYNSHGNRTRLCSSASPTSSTTSRCSCSATTAADVGKT